MAAGKVLVAASGGTQFIKLVGSIRHTMSRDLSAYIDGIFEGGRKGRVVFDLSETTDMDSTGLGLLARAARRAREAEAPRPLLMCANHDLGLIMSSMGFEGIFDVACERGGLPEAWEQVPISGGGGVEYSAAVIEAHKSLMDLSEKNRKTFEAVVEMMEKDLERKKK